MEAERKVGTWKGLSPLSAPPPLVGQGLRGGYLQFSAMALQNRSVACKSLFKSLCISPLPTSASWYHDALYVIPYLNFHKNPFYITYFPLVQTTILQDTNFPKPLSNPNC